MTALPDLRARVRADLGDPNACLWSDEELDRFIECAVQEFSVASPRRVEVMAATTPGAAAVPLHPLAGLLDVVEVEYPIDELPPRLVPASFSGGSVLLHLEGGPAGGPCRVTCNARHFVDGQGSTIPPQFEDLIVAGAAALAALDGAEILPMDRAAARARARLTAFRQLLHDNRPSVEVGGRTYRRPA